MIIDEINFVIFVTGSIDNIVEPLSDDDLEDNDIENTLLDKPCLLDNLKLPKGVKLYFLYDNKITKLTKNEDIVDNIINEVKDDEIELGSIAFKCPNIQKAFQIIPLLSDLDFRGEFTSLDIIKIKQKKTEKNGKILIIYFSNESLDSDNNDL